MRLNIIHESYNLKELHKRGIVLYIFLAVLFSLVLMRLVWLQIIQGDTLYAFSEKNLLKEIRVQPPRGVIFDRFGRILAENLPNFALTLSPQYIKNTEDLAEHLSPIIDIPAQDITHEIKKSIRQNGNYRPVVIKNFLSWTEINKVELLKLDFQGIDIEELIFRSQPYKDLFAHALGYIGEVSSRELPRLQEKGEIHVQQGDIIGKSGLEDRYDSYARGVPGISFVKVDAKGREALGESLKFLGHIDDLPPKHGDNLHTTLDLDLQQAAADAFKKTEYTGALIAINREGEILALYSHPTFDPNDFSKGITSQKWSSLVNNPSKPLRNKAIQDHLSPGSTFKPFVALSALQTKKISENSLVSAPSAFRFGNRTYHDHTQTGQGSITVTQAIEMSSNVFFYKQGLAVGVDTIAQYAKALGLGKLTGIDLKNEAPGLIPTTEWKKLNRGEPWQEGENLNIAIGQGYVNATILQLANAYMAIAMNGKVYQPRLINKVTNPRGDTIQEFPALLVTDLGDESKPYYISAENFKVVQKGLYRVANGEHGTARSSKIPNFIIAGKTGTAQVRGFSADEIYKSCYVRPLKQRHNGLFIAYGPYETPEITVAVLTEHSCSSSKSVPIVRDFYQSYVAKYHPDRLSKTKDMK
ncbi:MAG: penicillin-binding protein 2 [Bdellovibrionaceae bacterium]|nr:penicillin-binding protein 2 [Pseudobdellovibrionaceae bacterium]